MCEIYNTTRCVDVDCRLNVDYVCHDIGTILAHIPSTVYSCDGAIIDFVRDDYIDAID